MRGFLPSYYLAAKAERGESAKFEDILRASAGSPSGFENPTGASVLGLTNNNLGTGFMSYLDGSTMGMYPMRGFPDPDQLGLYSFPGVDGYRPSAPASIMAMRNSFFADEHLRNVG